MNWKMRSSERQFSARPAEAVAAATAAGNRPRPVDTPEPLRFTTLVAEHVHVALLHLVGLQALEAEPCQVPRARREPAQWHAWHALHRIGGDEGRALVHVLREPEIANRAVVGSTTCKK